MRRIVSLLVRISIAVAFVIGIPCVGLSPADAQEVPGVIDDTILIGTYAPVTGDFTNFLIFIHAAQAYIQRINEEGGVFGRKLELLVEDDQYNRDLPSNSK